MTRFALQTTTPATPSARRLVIEGEVYSREEIIHRYLPLVKYIAGRILVGLPRTVELGDLVNDGVIGLIDAIEKFDDTRGVKFDHYAARRIRGAIIDAIRALDPVSRLVRHLAKEVAHVKAGLDVELGRQATSDDVAVRIGIPVAKVREASFKALAGIAVSIDDPLRGELRDTLRATDQDPTAPVERRELRAEMSQAIGELPPLERFVVAAHYFEGRAMTSLAEELGLSVSRVSQIHAPAVRRLHERLAAFRTDFGFGVAEPPGPRKYMRSANRSLALLAS
jgi:RNA polymerase sigma factor for flagellar operon FliA